MSKAANAIEDHSAPYRGAADNDVLRFLSRTLQAHFLDAKPQDVLAKLQNLMVALEQQESTLSGWPDSPSKNRICTALATAQERRFAESSTISAPRREQQPDHSRGQRPVRRP